MADRRSDAAGDLFVRVLALAAADRPAWLDVHCADPALRTEVESLLAANDEAGEFLQTPVVDTDRIVFGEPDEDLSGRRLGPFRLESVLGRGGASTVYLAQRVEGDFDQTLAVKVIRRGMESHSLQQRFGAERKLLASLEHPGIARLIDGGVTPEGHSFLAMEYVDGLPIDRYCDENDLELDARLKLFQLVCAAVQHAHGRLIVHRDLKPSNILVNRAGRVKLLDFGIARLLDPGDEDAFHDGLTVTMQRMLTPRYASPEQVRGETVTTATDIYSLGVLLYELLCGRPPYRLSGSYTPAVEKTICHTEPERPSAVAGLDKPLGRRLAGDLDNIVLRAMRKEPGRRYISAERFAEDIQRHLQGLPVRARPDTFSYRTGKFLRRNLVAVVAAAAVVTALAGATAVSTRMYFESERARQEAETQRRTAAHTSKFLQEMLQAVDPVVRQSEDPVTVDQIFAEAAARIESELEDEPEVAATLHETIANAYLNLGEPEKARSHGLAQLDLRSRMAGPNSPPALRARLLLGRILFHCDETTEAATQFQSVLSEYNPEGQADELIAGALWGLGRIARREGDDTLAERHLLGAIALHRRLGAEYRESLATDLNEYGLTLVRSGRQDTAVVVLREALALMSEVRDEDHTFIGQIANNIGWALGNGEAWHEATPYFEQALVRYEGVFGPDHPNVLAARTNLARAYQKSGDLDRAQKIYLEVLAATRARFGSDHENVGHGLNNYALMLEEGRGDYSGAAELYLEALRIYRNRLGADHPWSAIAGFNAARALHQAGQLSRAETLSREALAVRRRVLRPGHPDIGRSEAQLVRITEGR